jgi:hypothetical protein
MAELEQSIVLAQPHRRGERSPLAESALGRFVLQYALDHACYECGLEYARVRGMYQSIIGAQRTEAHGGRGNDVPEELEQKWRDETKEWMDAMYEAGGKNGLSGVDLLIFENMDLLTVYDAHCVILSLTSLCKTMRGS